MLIINFTDTPADFFFFLQGFLIYRKIKEEISQERSRMKTSLVPYLFHDLLLLARI